MTIPQWNSEWEKPDPLRGRLGWSPHHYAAVGVAVVLFVTALGVLVPAVPKARQKEYEVDRGYDQLRIALAEGTVGASTRETIDTPRSEPPREAPAVQHGPLVFTDPKGRFSVTFPTAPVPRPPSKEEAGGPFQLVHWVAFDGNTRYTTSAIYAPVELLDASFDLAQVGQGDDNPLWRAVTRRAVTVDGRPGLLIEYAAIDGVRASVSVTTRYEGTVVTLSVSGAKGLTGESEGAKAFFESLRFVR